MATEVRPLWPAFSENPSAANGTMEFYKAGTTTPKNYYDKDGVSQGSTASLNAYGMVTGGAYGTGNYKIIIKDSGGSQIGDPFDNLAVGFAITEGWVYDIAAVHGSYDSTAIAAAIAAIGSDKVTALIKRNPSGNWATSANLAFHANTLVEIANGAPLDNDGGGNTLDIPKLTAGSYQIFTGYSAGNITIGAGTPEVILEWFGGVGDDSNDDTLSLQSALDCGNGRTIAHANKIFQISSVNISSDTVLVVRGTLKSTDGLQDMITCNTAIDKVKIIGEGNGRLDGNQPGSGTHFSRGIYLYHASGISDVKVTGLEIDDWYTDGLAIYDCAKARIHHNFVHDNGANNIKIEAMVANASDIKVDDNVCDGTGAQNNIFFYAASGFTLTNFSCNDNHLLNPNDGNIEIGLRCNDGTVDGNTAKGATGATILLRGCTGVTVNGNRTDGGGAGIMVWSNTAAPADPIASGISICGNTCTGSNYDVNSAGIRTNGPVKDVMITGNNCSYNFVGISIVQGSNISACSNSCFNNQGQGIVVLDTDGFDVDNNKCYDNDTVAPHTVPGIGVYKNSVSPTNGTVTRNKCYDTGGATQTIGIQIDNTLNTSVESNYCRGHTLGQGIVKTGVNTNTHFSGNRLSTDPLKGTFTLDVAATTTILNANIDSTSQILIMPTNVAAAALMAGSKSLYLSARNLEEGFVMATANGTNPAGTETFSYEIR